MPRALVTANPLQVSVLWSSPAERGFARVVCPSCHYEILVPFLAAHRERPTPTQDDFPF